MVSRFFGLPFLRSYTFTSQTHEYMRTASAAGCFCCGAKPVLQVVHQRGFCRKHLAEAREYAQRYVKRVP